MIFYDENSLQTKIIACKLKFYVFSNKNYNAKLLYKISPFAISHVCASIKS